MYSTRLLIYVFILQLTTVGCPVVPHAQAEPSVPSASLTLHANRRANVGHNQPTTHTTSAETSYRDKFKINRAHPLSKLHQQPLKQRVKTLNKVFQRILDPSLSQHEQLCQIDAIQISLESLPKAQLDKISTQPDQVVNYDQLLSTAQQMSLNRKDFISLSQLKNSISTLEQLADEAVAERQTNKDRFDKLRAFENALLRLSPSDRNRAIRIAKVDFQHLLWSLKVHLLSDQDQLAVKQVQKLIIGLQDRNLPKKNQIQSSLEIYSLMNGLSQQAFRHLLKSTRIDFGDIFVKGFSLSVRVTKGLLQKAKQYQEKQNAIKLLLRLYGERNFYPQQEGIIPNQKIPKECSPKQALKVLSIGSTLMLVKELFSVEAAQDGKLQQTYKTVQRKTNKAVSRCFKSQYQGWKSSTASKFMELMDVICSPNSEFTDRPTQLRQKCDFSYFLTQALDIYSITTDQQERVLLSTVIQSMTINMDPNLLKPWAQTVGQLSPLAVLNSIDAKKSPFNSDAERQNFRALRFVSKTQAMLRDVITLPGKRYRFLMDAYRLIVVEKNLNARTCYEKLLGSSKQYEQLDSVLRQFCKQKDISDALFFELSISAKKSVVAQQIPVLRLDFFQMSKYSQMLVKMNEKLQPLRQMGLFEPLSREEHLEIIRRQRKQQKESSEKMKILSPPPQGKINLIVVPPAQVATAVEDTLVNLPPMRSGFVPLGEMSLGGIDVDDLFED